ncbi:GLPGLI family protein [uncultured Bacteroides sp.]|uniref:GLPGLI family protein n=1 Tax=uncultured Bacteroides sp. TaxID=162156 RepID=UPI002AAC2FD6|nr:GLPGLI family protein [uncultured Bacteroides sp.]
MKSLIFSFILLVNCAALNAQTLKITGDMPKIHFKPLIVLDTTFIRCQYRQRIVTSTDSITKRKTGAESTMLLQIGHKISKYADLKFFIADSLSKVDIAEGVNVEKIVNRRLAVTRGASDLTIVKNYPENKITNIDRVPFDYYMYTEYLVSPEWVIKKDTMTICGYLCKQAITTFRGRNYKAWYAPEIAISSGPWKFIGLPGLILKITDDKKEIDFECISIENPHWIDRVYIEKSDYIKTTKTTFEGLKKKFMNNPAAFLQNSPFIKGELLENASQKRLYNPIELID